MLRSDYPRWLHLQTRLSDELRGGHRCGCLHGLRHGSHLRLGNNDLLRHRLGHQLHGDGRRLRHSGDRLRDSLLRSHDLLLRLRKRSRRDGHRLGDRGLLQRHLLGSGDGRGG